MRKIRRLALVVLISSVFLVPVMVGSGSCSYVKDQYGLTGEAPEVGKRAPDFQLAGFDGVKTKLSDLKGKPVVLNFWATWCGYCVEEMPLLQEINDKWSGKGLIFLAINSGETGARVENFLEANGYNFTVLLDRYQDVLPFYRVTGLPTTFFIDADGVIQYIKVGAFVSVEQIELNLETIMP
jgi:thiol-disulfide isomerase/thioredoxin